MAWCRSSARVPAPARIQNLPPSRPIRSIAPSAMRCSLFAERRKRANLRDDDPLLSDRMTGWSALIGAALRSRRPGPVAHLGHVLEVLDHVGLMTIESPLAFVHQRVGIAERAPGPPEGLD